MVRSLLALIALSLIAALALQPQARASGCSVSVFRPAGHESQAPLRGGPGLVLSGGGFTGMPRDRVFPWLRAHVQAPPNTRAGNLLILKASGGRDYSDDFYKTSQLASIREILIPPCASNAAVDAAAPYAERADFVLFAGGDQAHYVAWKNTKLIAAVRAVYARGGVVGGGSAGLAIQGQVVFDSVSADRVLPNDEDVATPDAVRNPYERAISFTTGFFAWPPLRDSITDTHFARRDRFGRLAAFMARSLQDRLVRGPVMYGVAVDEAAVLLVDRNGIAHLYQRARESDGYVPRGAYILTGTRQHIVPGRPLRYTVNVQHLTGNGATYDLLHKQGAQKSYRVTVDGSKEPPYSRSPY